MFRFLYNTKTISICFCLWSFVLSCATQQPLFSNENRKSTINTIIKDLSFFPINGERFRLSELKNKRAIVFVMRENNCPISEKYGSRLILLERQYSPLGIQFIYSYVGQVKIKENAQKDLKKFGFKGFYTMDIKQDLINALGVQNTGDIFILTPHRKIIYKGPLEDQHHALKWGYKAKNNYVADRLEKIVTGKTVIPKELSDPGCIVSRPVIKEKVFFKDVAPVISKKCTICHNPKASGFINYLTYEDIAGRSDMFRYVIEENLMPPWNVDPAIDNLAYNISLSVKEKALLLKWLDKGLPKKLGTKTINLWHKKHFEKNPVKPDYVLDLPKKVKIPAKGMNDYKFFIIPNPFKEDKWIKKVNFVTKPKVIHHMWMFILDPNFTNNENLQSINLRKYATTLIGTNGQGRDQMLPNRLDTVYKAGYKLPSRSKIALEIHYESIGKKVIDDFTHVEFYFYKKKPKYKFVSRFLALIKFNIPPHTLNYTLKIPYKIHKTEHLIGVYPHMHLRGKASSVYLINPEGKRKRLFSIDPFLFKFQWPYIFKKPIIVEKGSILECIQYYDNSSFNPVNPNPRKKVNFGLLLEDEMSDCYLFFLAPIDSNDKDKWIHPDS